MLISHTTSEERKLRSMLQFLLATCINEQRMVMESTFILVSMNFGGGWGAYTGRKNPAPLHILGSFVNLWTSVQAKSEWCPAGGDCYSAPTRNWGWDVRFQDPDFWPPFIPSVFSVERVGFLEK